MPSTSKTKAPFKYSNLSKSLKPRTFQRRRRQGFSPTFGVGLLDFNFNSSPRPELFSSPGTLLLARSTPRDSLDCPITEIQDFPNCPARDSWSAQPQGLPGVPRVSRNPQPQSFFRVFLESPSLLECTVFPRVSLECPTPETPCNAQRVWSGVESSWSAQFRDFLECPSKSLRWGCSKKNTLKFERGPGVSGCGGQALRRRRLGAEELRSLGGFKDLGVGA